MKYQENTVKISAPDLTLLIMKIGIVLFSLLQAANWSSIVDAHTASYITAGIAAIATVVHVVWGLDFPVVNVTGLPKVVEDTTKLKAHWFGTVFAIGAFVSMVALGGCSVTTNGVPLTLGVSGSIGDVSGSISTNGTSVTATGSLSADGVTVTDTGTVASSKAN